jgi:hypothetical protein
MSRISKILLAAALSASLAAPALGQVAVPVPVPPPPPPVAAPGLVPGWVAVPAGPGVHYAPNLGIDVFRCKGKYYYYHGGYWYRGKHLHGPWHPVRKVPKPLRRVNRSYFRSPPPW